MRLSKIMTARPQSFKQSCGKEGFRILLTNDRLNFGYADYEFKDSGIGRCCTCPYVTVCDEQIVFTGSPEDCCRQILKEFSGVMNAWNIANFQACVKEGCDMQ